MRHIITLSSIPPRFARLAPALKSLLAQTSKPEAIELHIPRSYRRFPTWGGGLPEVPEGVRIVRVDEDLGPATKILPAARAYRGQEIELIYVDDDRHFHKDWARLCLALRKDHPGATICGAGFRVQERYGYGVSDTPLPQAVVARDSRLTAAYHFRRLLWQFGLHGQGPAGRKFPWQRFDQSGHVDIASGYGGVMVRPDFFDDAAFDIPPVLWTVDDIWLSGMLTRRGVPIWADKELFRVWDLAETSGQFPLQWAVIDGADRRGANMACIDYMKATYGIWGGAAVQST